LFPIFEDTVQKKRLQAALAAKDMFRRSVNDSLPAKSPPLQKCSGVQLESIIEEMYTSNKLNSDNLKKLIVDDPAMAAEKSRSLVELVNFVITDD